MRVAASIALVFGVIAACGGATSSNLFGDGGSSSGSSGSTSGGSADGSTPGADGSVPPDLTTCSKPGTCELAAAGCCGITCQPGAALIGIQRGQSAALRAATCDQSKPVACPDCASKPEANFQAFCKLNKCTVVDIRTDDLSSCSGDDCVLQYGSCCQSCSGGSISEIISVRKGREDDLAEQLCSGTEACAKCLPVFPPTLRAVCDRNTRHCVVQQL